MANIPATVCANLVKNYRKCYELILYKINEILSLIVEVYMSITDLSSLSGRTGTIND